MFSSESLAQLEAAGVQIHKTVKGIAAGRDMSDITNALTAVALTQECTDEIKADNDKAVSYMLGSALRAHGAS
jgi:hypothetical protein